MHQGQNVGVQELASYLLIILKCLFTDYLNCSKVNS